MMPVAEKAEEVISMSYGERWVDIPEVADQITHAFVSDQEIPCDIYDIDIKNFIDKKEFLDFSYRKKDIWFDHLKDRNLANGTARSVSQIMILEKIKKSVDEITIEELVKEKKYVELKRIFQDYYSAQFSDFKYYRLYFDMPETYFLGALSPLAVTGSYNKAMKVLTMRESRFGEPQHASLKKLRDLCTDLAELSRCLYIFNDLARAKEIVSKWLPQFPECITLMCADIYLLLKEDEPDTGSIRTKTVKYLKIFVEDGELLKYLGDTYRIDGDEKMAVRIYRRALGTVTNGLLMTEMKKYLENSAYA